MKIRHIDIVAALFIMQNMLPVPYRKGTTHLLQFMDLATHMTGWRFTRQDIDTILNTLPKNKILAKALSDAGFGQQAIAKALNISQPGVSYAVNSVTKENLENYTHHVLSLLERDYKELTTSQNNNW